MTIQSPARAPRARPASVRIGSRGSALALIQAGLVRDALAQLAIESSIEVITTAGDRREPDTAWGEGAFVTAIEDALRRGDIDAAVHSAKDVPTDEAAGLTIAAYLPRAAAGDVVVLPGGRAIGSLDALPVGSRVGTDSPRRSAFLRAIRPDLVLHPLHGNVDTRLRRLDAGETDALVLAEAGLTRLGRAERISLRLDPEVVPPAPGQGALAVQVRSEDQATVETIRELDDPGTRRAVEIERALLAATGGGCRAPIGAVARIDGHGVSLLAGFARVDGSNRVVVSRVAAASVPGEAAQRRQAERPERADAAGTAAVPQPGRAASIQHPARSAFISGKVTGSDARESRSRPDSELVGAALQDLVAEAARQSLAAGAPPLLVTRAVEQAAPLSLALIDAGFAPLRVPAIRTEPVSPNILGAVVRGLSEFDWVVVTSANGVAAVGAAARHAGLGLRPDGRRPRWAVVGSATRRALAEAGIEARFQPPRAAGRALAEALPLVPGEKILVLRSDIADERLVGTLRARGADVEAVTAYRTLEAPESSLAPLARALDRGPAGTILTSGSTARGLLTLATRLRRRQEILNVVTICIGPETVIEAERLGFRVAAAARMQGPRGIAEAAAAALRPGEPVPSPGEGAS